MISRNDIYCKTQTNKYVKRSTRGYSFRNLVKTFYYFDKLNKLNKYIYIYAYMYLSIVYSIPKSLYYLFVLFD